MEWKRVYGFPDYEVSDEGDVRWSVGNRSRRLSPSRTQRGAAKVTLYRDGKAATRSLALLVADAFVWNDDDPEIFDTPIHRDGDLMNNRADNLLWRPRWFALKYQRQWWKESFRFGRPLFMEEKTGRIYDNYMEACADYGILYTDLIQCMDRNQSPFPSVKRFVTLRRS